MWLEEGETEDSIVWWTQRIRSQDVVGGRRDRGLYDGRNVSGARIWLEVGKTEDCMAEAVCKERDVAGGRGERGQYGGRNVSGARMWLQVRETGDSMVDAMYREPGWGWK